MNTNRRSAMFTLKVIYYYILELLRPLKSKKVRTIKSAAKKGDIPSAEIHKAIKKAKKGKWE